MSISNSRSMPERLYEALSEDIRQGTFPVGTRLPIEAALCSLYGVSRTVLREAVARLKADGMLDTQQGRGTFVLAAAMQTPFRLKHPSDNLAQFIAELAELRLGVEGTAAALAATRRTPAQLATLQACLQRMQAAINDGTSGADADLEFHQTIAEATSNGHYQMFMEYLQRSYAIAIDAARSSSAMARDFSQQAQREHQAIFNAIQASDAVAAEDAIKKHIRAAAARMAAGPAARGAEVPGTGVAEPDTGCNAQSRPPSRALRK